MIPLSLVLVVTSVVTLGFGVFTTSTPLVWVSLAAGLGAVALVTGSVVRRRRLVGPGAAADAAVPPDPSPASPGGRADRARPLPEPPGSPDLAGPRSWPWSTTPPTGPRGWTGEVPGVRPPADPPTAPQPVSRPADAPPADSPPAGRETAGRETAGREAAAGAERAAAAPEPFVEEGMEAVPVRDALRVAQLADEVLVADGQPRYHLTGCAQLAGAEPLPLAVSDARRAGFTPCATCTPDRILLDRARDRGGRVNDER